MLKNTITLVEDDPQFSALVCEFLENEGFIVSPIYDGDKAAAEIIDKQPDTVILDIILPGIDGIEVCRRIRQKFHNPIIMLTASHDDFAEISALNSGADKYIEKPIKPQVLLAHIKAALKWKIDPIHTADSIKSTSTFKNIELNEGSREVTLGDQVIDLTSGEFDLLQILVKAAGRCISREDLYQQIKGVDYDGIDRSIDLRISNLRKKLKDIKQPYQLIKTIRNRGYMVCKS